MEESPCHCVILSFCHMTIRDPSYYPPPPRPTGDDHDFKLSLAWPGLTMDSICSVCTSLVHSHWSRNIEARLSLVENFPSDAGASSLMQ